MEIVAIILFLGVLVVPLIWSINKWTKQQDEKERSLIKYSAAYAGLLKHIEGLPMTSGCIIEFFYGTKKITFKKDNQEISLECKKIISIDLVSGKDVKTQAAAGAVAGKYLIGGLGGATLGAILTTTIYLAILYKNEDENKTILLDTTGSDLPFRKILDDFKYSYQKETQKIEL